jgi:hypothetical protein
MKKLTRAQIILESVKASYHVTDYASTHDGDGQLRSRRTDIGLPLLRTPYRVDNPVWQLNSSPSQVT